MKLYTPILLFILLGYQCPQLHGANHSIGDGESIIVYDDGLLAPVVKAVDKTMGDELKKRGIRLDDKSNKGAGLISFQEKLEKDVIKKEPQIAVLSFGIYDVCDPKKGEVFDYNIDALKAALSAAVTQLHEAEIKVVLCTPGLAGEDLSTDVQAHVDKLADMIRSVANEMDTGLCDVRKHVVDYLENNKPEKPGRTQLTKKGVKWDDAGEELLAPKLMAALGLSKSGIQRAIKFDERVLLATSMGVWTVKVEDSITKAMEATEPQKPKDFFNPGINGPKSVDLAIGDIYDKAADIEMIKKQKPSVVFVYVLSKWCTYPKYERRNVEANLDTLMQQLSALTIPVWIFTPLWMNEDGQKNLTDKTGTRYQRCKEAADLIKQYAGKHGVAVIDLFTLSQNLHASDQNKVFYGPYEADPKQLILAEDGRALIIQEMKCALGLLAAGE